VSVRIVQLFHCPYSHCQNVERPSEQ
jgi:hypothetical protein